jgi:putative membrane protein
MRELGIFASREKLVETLILFFSACGLVFAALKTPWLIGLTPVYLSGTVLGALYAGNATKKICLSLVVAGGLGFLAELIGVHTGLLFGDYSYGSVLGLGIVGVPILIFVLWALVPWLAWSMTLGIELKWRILATSLLCVLYDIPLEFFAREFGLWAWVGPIPFSNFVSWFAVSYAIATVFRHNNVPAMPKRLAQVVFCTHFVFFIATLLLY